MKGVFELFEIKLNDSCLFKIEPNLFIMLLLLPFLMLSMLTSKLFIEDTSQPPLLMLWLIVSFLGERKDEWIIYGFFLSYNVNLFI